jgi:hypothetical protein
MHDSADRSEGSRQNLQQPLFTLSQKNRFSASDDRPQVSRVPRAQDDYHRWHYHWHHYWNIPTQKQLANHGGGV